MLDTELLRAAKALKALGGHARKLLEECVETQGTPRAKVSKTAEALESLGLLFIRDLNFWGTEVLLTPSIWGEEALAALEELESAALSVRNQRHAGHTEALTA